MYKSSNRRPRPPGINSGDPVNRDTGTRDHGVEPTMDRPNWLTFPNQGPPEVRIFAFGCLLGSLTQSLRLTAQTIPAPSRSDLLLQADLLLRYWANLQDVMLDGNASYSEALIHPIVERLQESLEDAYQLSPEPTRIYQELRRGLEVFSSPKFLVES